MDVTLRSRSECFVDNLFAKVVALDDSPELHEVVEQLRAALHQQRAQ